MTAAISPSRPGPALLIEAAVAIVLASIAIRTEQFANVATRAIRSRRQHPANPQRVAEVSRAVAAVARRVPWRAKCIEEGVAAAHMLSRRGYAATLHYGAAMIAGNLEAHVWVRSGEIDVIGCENSGKFAILSQFSNDSSSSPVHS